MLRARPAVHRGWIRVAFDPVELPIPVGASAQGVWLAQVMDANGDGMPDIAQVSATDGKVHIWLRQGGPIDEIKDVNERTADRPGDSFAQVPWGPRR